MNCGRELLKGSTDSLLLCLIKSQPMYGYQIIKKLEKKSDGYFQFKEGTLYPALHRLEKTGLIKGKWEQLSGGQERRYYYITEKGQKALDERLAIWRGFYEAVNLIMLPVTCMEHR
jgi:DNA-binding PadR family transcriptional regulator